MTLRQWFYVTTFALLGVFVYALYIDHFREWKPYQREYYRRMAAETRARMEKAASPEEKQRLSNEVWSWDWRGLAIKQIIARDLGRADRCVTCHVGMDEFTNPSLTNDFKENPYKPHPDLSGLVKKHSFQKFGCVVCHGGQGLATTVRGAHEGIEVHYGESHIASQYMLRPPFLQANCAKCHADLDKTRGAEVAAKGKALFEKHGCVGCHSINGVGGIISVDLGDIADKPPERIAPHDFHLAKMPADRESITVQNWILAHMTRDPMTFVRNDPEAKFNLEPIAPSGMPPYYKDFKEGDGEAIATWLLSHSHEEKIPREFYVYAAPKPEPKFASAAEHGKFVFQKFGCAGCHGIDGKKGRRNFNGLAKTQKQDASKPGDFEEMAKGEEPTLPDTMGTFTRDELRVKIQNGVPPTSVAKFNPEGPTPPGFMPPWKEKVKGPELEDLISYLQSIAKKEEGGW